jgi:hypothetical protein
LLRTVISAEQYRAKAEELERKAAEAKTVEARADLYVVAACLRSLAHQLQQDERADRDPEPRSWK